MELIAHRAANRVEGLAEALAVADAVEMDVHLDRGRLVTRHSKVLRPTSVLWEPWHLSDEVPGDAAAIVEAAGRDANLWIDLKGFTPILTRRVLALLGRRLRTTCSCRSWWLLRPVRGREGMRTVRSIGARWQLRLATRSGAGPSPDGHGVPDRFASTATIAALQRRHPMVAVWGVTSVERIVELDELGVTSIIVDDLGLIASARHPPSRTVSGTGDDPTPTAR